MNRRGFLQGVFGGVTAAGILITAKPEEIQAFTSPLIKDSSLVLDRLPLKHTSIGEHLYNEHGEIVAIVSSINISRPKIDVTSAWDTNRQYVQGMPTIEIVAVGLGQLNFDGKNMPKLRGNRR